MSLPPWDQQTFTFNWEPWAACSIPQCSTLDINFNTDDLVTIPNPPAAPPFSVHVYQGGYAPLTLPVGNIGQRGTYPWTVNLQLNATFMVTMSESKGYTGGTSHRCTVIPGNSRCLPGATPTSPMSLNFTRSGNSQCGNVNIVVNNGVSPFQVEIIPDGSQQKTPHFATNSFDFVLDLGATLPYFIVVTDAESHSAVDGILAVGSSSDNSCLGAATTMAVGMFTSVFSGSGVVMPSSTLTSAGTNTSTSTSTSTSVGATTSASTQQGSSNSSTTPIIGGVTSGVVVTIALVLFLWWMLRRRQRKRREAATSPQAIQDPKPEMGYANPGYTSYVPQYGYNGVPEIQESTTGYISQPYTPPGAVATGQFYDPHVDSSPIRHNNITMHAPQARPLTQSTSYLSDPSTSQQSPVSHRFSQNTGTTSSLVGVHNSAEGNPTSPPWGTDWKERIVSPLLGSRVQPWETATSPSRSLTSTVLPPYEPVSKSRELNRAADVLL